MKEEKTQYISLLEVETRRIVIEDQSVITLEELVVDQGTRCGTQ